MSVVIFGKQCKHCSKFKSPHEIWDMPGGATICRDCQEVHERSILALSELMSGGLPGCPVCKKTTAELQKLAGGGDYPMHIHMRDGIYIPHCQQCHDGYAFKRKDLYRGTKFGETLRAK